MEIQEDMPMLRNEEQIYQSEKDPKNDGDTLGGFNVQRTEESFRRGDSIPLHSQPWSNRFSGCFGIHGEFCTNVDVEICFGGTVSPYVLYANKSQRFNIPGLDNPAPSQQTMQ